MTHRVHPDNPWGLTEREAKVLLLIVEECLPTKCVADRLCISLKTAETHRANAIRKLQARSTPDLCKRYWTWALAPSSPPREEMDGALGAI